MKRTRYIYAVYVELEFTRAEVEIAIEWSQTHYDARCRAASIPGPGAFLNALRNMLEYPEPSESATTMLSVQDLDVLAKILEPWRPGFRKLEARALYDRVVDELRAAVQAAEKINGRTA